MRFLVAFILLSLKKFFLKLSSICGTLVVLILNPRDHERLTRWFYEQKEAVEIWGNQGIIERGLVEEEEAFVQNYLKGKEKCLVLHCGGGREAVALAKRGFSVKGVDRSEALIEQAKRYAEKEGVRCEYLLQDVLKLSLGEHFDAIFLGSNMYSAIPLKEWRIDFLKRVKEHLTEKGLFYMEFASRVSPEETGNYPLKKFFARLFGNRFYELGDALFAGWHYQHAFVKEEDVRKEIDSSGFSIERLDFENGYAILRSG